MPRNMIVRVTENLFTQIDMKLYDACRICNRQRLGNDADSRKAKLTKYMGNNKQSNTHAGLQYYILITIPQTEGESTYIYNY